jgi:hypothetical protein
MEWFCTGPEGSRFEFVETDDYTGEQREGIRVAGLSGFASAFIPLADFDYAAKRWLAERPEE